MSAQRVIQGRFRTPEARLFRALRGFVRSEVARAVLLERAADDRPDLNALLVQANTTAGELAALSGGELSAGTISNWCAGVCLRPKPAKVRLLASLLRMSVRDVAGAIMRARCVNR